MCHHASDFGDQPTCRHKERSPGRIRAGADEDFAGSQLRAARVEDDVDNPFGNPRRDGTPADKSIRIRCRAEPFIEGAPVAEEHARNLLPAVLTLINGASFGNQ